MDCEKFDQIIIDAVYDDLDELTLAAAKLPILTKFAMRFEQEKML